MLSVTIQIVFNAGFIALMVLIWRISKRPRWRIRSVIYGWAAIFLWAFLWSAILPMSLRGVMDSHTLADTFPDGTIAAAALFGGWFLPLILVAISNSPRKKTDDDHVA
jgi:TRAP-type C4-dicarboxylate transport system permease small subunit